MTALGSHPWSQASFSERSFPRAPEGATAAHELAKRWRSSFRRNTPLAGAPFRLSVEHIVKSTALTVVIWLLIVPPAVAQVTLGPLAIDSCEDYVARASSQVQMATGCNFPGPRWSQDLVAHMTWCKDASARERGREDDERRKALVACRGDFGVVPIKNCNDYAARSRSQIDLAQTLGSSCTFEGMRWSSNVVQHMNWCNRNPASRHESEDAARRKELAACKANSK